MRVIVLPMGNAFGAWDNDSGTAYVEQAELCPKTLFFV